MSVCSGSFERAAARRCGDRGRRLALAAAVLCGLAMPAGPDARAIEMFTFFGDGSRIGLPSLEVPIEAYPGIPLRSDRLRARRRGQPLPPPAAATAPLGAPRAARGMALPALPAEARAALTPPPARRSARKAAAPVAPEPPPLPASGQAGS